MQGKLFRQLKDGCIYEVIGKAENFDSAHHWTLWSERTGERQSVPDMKLRRQLGWELVGKSERASAEETQREVPPALMK